MLGQPEAIVAKPLGVLRQIALFASACARPAFNDGREIENGEWDHGHR